MSESAKLVNTTGAEKPGHYYLIRYTFLGVAFGFAFPIAATLVVLWERGLTLSLSAIVEAYSEEPLLWIIATAPIFLGAFASLAGYREDRLQRSRTQLQETVELLKERVTDKSRDLDRAVEVGHSVTEAKDLEEMLAQAVELIRSGFELYYVQVYLPDASDRNLFLRAGTGHVGKMLLSQGQRMPLGLGSIVGTAAVEKQVITVANTANSELYFSNPLLPDTISEMAMPLIMGDQMIGVLDLQSDIPGQLTVESQPVLEAVAGQLAIAIENARLVTEATKAQSEIEAHTRRTIQTEWQDYLNAIDRSEVVGFTYEEDTVTAHNEPLGEDIEGDSLTASILVTGEPIGAIQIQGINGRPWTPDEESLVAAVAEQIAWQVEGLRLLAEADHYRSEAEEASRRLTRDGWQAYLKTQESSVTGFEYADGKVEPLADGYTADQDTVGKLKRSITVRGGTIGQLEVDHSSNMEEETVELVTAVADQLSTHLESLRLNEQTERALADKEDQAQRLAALNDLGQALAGASTIEDIYKVTAIGTSQIIPSDRISIAILSDDRESFEILALHGENGATKVGDLVSANGTVLASSIEQNRVVIVNQSNGDGPRGIESFMVAPLTAGGRTFGTLNAGSDKAHAFDRRSESLLLQAASLLASTLESWRLIDQTVQRAEELSVISQLAQTRADELAVLNELGQALTSSNDIDSVMAIVHSFTARLMDATSFYLALYDAETDEVDIRIFGEGEEIDPAALRRRAGRGITEYVIQSGNSLLIEEDVAERVEEIGIEPHGRMAKSWLGAPLLSGNQVIGVIAVQNFTTTHAYNVHHRDLLVAVANQTATTIENARLFEQVQERARREHILREITARVRSSSDIDAVMRTAAQEVGRALGRQTFVYLDDKKEKVRVEKVEE